MYSSTRYFRLNRNGALAARYSPFLLPSFHSGFLMTFFSPIICLFLRFRSLFFSFLLCLVWVALVQLVLVGSCWLELLLLVFSWNSRVDSLFTEERERKKREGTERWVRKTRRRARGEISGCSRDDWKCIHKSDVTNRCQRPWPPISSHPPPLPFYFRLPGLPDRLL